MVVVNRLTGHSTGFLSVYTLPPNQAVSIASQLKINTRRRQTPPRRDLRAIVNRKSASLLADVDKPTRQTLMRVGSRGRFHTGSCTGRFWRPGSVQLVVTSPPFLDVVNYAADNWLRCWFCGVDSTGAAIDVHATSTRGARSSRPRFDSLRGCCVLARMSRSRSAKSGTAPCASRTSSFLRPGRGA